MSLALPKQTGAENVSFEAEIEDVSRQTIASHATALVHPAEFYVALRRPKETFPSVGAPLRVEVGLQLEVLPPDVFLHVHEELAADGARSGLIFHFRPQHRLGLTPLGYVTVTPVRTGLSIAAFHTFPDEFAVVKTQSLIELE